METRKLLFCNAKGGIGKTTLCLCAGIFLAKEARVLLVDLDFQGNLSQSLERKSEKKTISDLFEDTKGITAKDVVYPATWGGGKYPFQNLFIMPAEGTLSEAGAYAVKRRKDPEKILFNALQEIEEHYDYILIDSPPSQDIMVANGIYAANEVYIPIDMTRWSESAIEDVARLLKKRMQQKALPQIKVILNKIDGRYKKLQESMRYILQDKGYQILKSEIRTSSIYEKANTHLGASVFLTERTRAEEDFTKLTAELKTLQNEIKT